MLTASLALAPSTLAGQRRSWTVFGSFPSASSASDGFNSSPALGFRVVAFQCGSSIVVRLAPQEGSLSNKLGYGYWYRGHLYANRQEPVPERPTSRAIVTARLEGREATTSLSSLV